MISITAYYHVGKNNSLVYILFFKNITHYVRNLVKT